MRAVAPRYFLDCPRRSAEKHQVLRFDGNDLAGNVAAYLPAPSRGDPFDHIRHAPIEVWPRDEVADHHTSTLGDNLLFTKAIDIRIVFVNIDSGGLLLNVSIADIDSGDLLFDVLAFKFSDSGGFAFFGRSVRW